MDKVQRLEKEIMKLCSGIKYSVMLSTQLEGNFERDIFVETGWIDAFGYQTLFYIVHWCTDYSGELYDTRKWHFGCHLNELR
jgi:hypothetical protein